MSLQNILVPNNYTIYANEFDVNEVVVDVLKGPSDVITLASSLVPSVADSTAFHIGAVNQYISDIWCERLHGPGAPVNIPLGLTFNDADPAAPITNYSIDYYAEFSGTMTASVAIQDTVVNYTAVRIGSVVNFTFGFDSQNALAAGTTNPILIQSLPADLRPIAPRIIVVPAQRNGIYQPGGLLINTDGTMQLYADTLLTLFFPVNGVSGLYIPDGDVCCISYNIN